MSGLAIAHATAEQVGQASTWVAGEDVVIGAGSVTRLTATTPALGRVTVQGTIEFAAADAVLKASALIVENGGVITQTGPVTHGEIPARIAIECSGLLAILKGGRIEADGRGFAGGVGRGRNDDPGSAGHGPGAGGYPPVWGMSSGGSHGGRGGAPTAMPAYGSPSQPLAPGSGGGGGNGAGGGAILIEAPRLKVEGTITANGGNGVGNSYGGGGSGGSILIRCQTLEGGGALRVDGGIGSRYAGGGGGGRIAVASIDHAPVLVAPTLLLSAAGGVNGGGLAAAIRPDTFGWPGTIFVSQQTPAGIVRPHSGFVITSTEQPVMPEQNPTVALATPWLVNKPIASMTRELFRERPRPTGAAAMASRVYVGPRLELMETQSVESRDDVATERTARWSSDNGRTWGPRRVLPDTLQHYQGREVHEAPGPSEWDPASSLLVRMWLRQIQVGNIWANGQCHNFTYYRLSGDHGQTWSDPKQLRYEPGPDFDPQNPLNAAFLGPNEAYFGNNILRHSNGTLVHCVTQANTTGDPRNDTRAWRLSALCFVGRWNAERQDYDWTNGQRVSLPDDVSSRGLMEAEVAELRDGRVLVIWRGSDTPTTPGRKWYSVSSDGGMTLTPVRELMYDDGTRFYSPSSIHRAIRHSGTGKLYWIGNITPLPPKGNSPRYPLIIAEIDESGPSIRKSTVTLIDDRQDDEGFDLQLSNFSLIEDRETHEFELILTKYGQEHGGQNWTNADCYRYRVKLSEGEGILIDLYSGSRAGIITP